MASSASQHTLPYEDILTAEAPANDTSGTFADNLRLPVHRWFRFSAGFSAEWVRLALREHAARGLCRVLDPFAGSGTVLVEAQRMGVPSMGVEAHPFISRVARAKLCWGEDVEAFTRRAEALLDEARGRGPIETDNALLRRCFPPEVLSDLMALRDVWSDRDNGDAISQLLWLALVSCIRPCSPVGTAQWQYLLPARTKRTYLAPFGAFAAMVHSMVHDMRLMQRHAENAPAGIVEGDARTCAGVPDGWANLVITSPPYANNYDYADATRLEMTFLGEVQRWGDLQDAVRVHLVRACTQHVARDVGATFEAIEQPLLRPIHDELVEVCRALQCERERHGGKKNYHTMIALYFHDLAHVWSALRRATAPGAEVCFVIGDSAPYGVYVPVERWLGELAVAAGFTDWRFEKLRDRNTKWKNRKHRVPLKEGRLWVEG